MEDTERLRRTLTEVLRARAAEVVGVGTVAEARDALSALRPDLLVLDFKLPDGSGLEVLEAAASVSPAPVVVAISGTAGPADTFRLAELGVRAYLEKPIALADFERALEQALTRAPDLSPHVRSAVGRVGIKDVEAQVRETMVKEAIARSGGNRRGAARLLRVSRQLLQHMLRKL